MTDFRFLGEIPIWAGVGLTLLLACAAWALYRREVYDLPSPYRWLLPLLRSAAIAMAIVMLLEPSIHRRHFQGQPGQVRVLIDGSGSMGIPDDAASVSEARPRFDRAIDALLEGDAPLLAEIARTNEVTVSRFAGDEQTRLWESTLKKTNELPSEKTPWRPASWLGPTRLGEVLLLESVSRQTASEENPNSDKPQDTSKKSQADSNEQMGRGPIVLFTDGQNNAGPSPLESLDRLKSENRPVFAVGFGTPEEPNDVAILSVDNPKQVFQTDTLRGSLVIKDSIAAGKLIHVKISHRDQVVWERNLTSDSTGQRSIEFAFPVESIVKAELAGTERGLDYTRLPIEVTADIDPVAGDLDADNNSQIIRFSATTRRQRVLLLDSRSRWETRYLRNALERDPNWTVDAYLLYPGEQPKWYSQTDKEKPLPSTEEQWFDYDLVITGEIEPNSLNPNQVAWLARAIEGAGCGWIVLDGNRQTWRDPSYETLWKGLPVELLPYQSTPDQSLAAKPSDAGIQLSALQLTKGTAEDNQKLWAELPKMRFAANVKPLPGSEVIATLDNGSESKPFLVTRQYGAGRVLYVASDESWRWRYNVADTYHQRFWNQISRWVMRVPFAVDGEFLSLDAGDSTYDLGQSITISARLRDSSGLPAKTDLVEAILVRDGATIATIPLQADGSFPGVYRGNVDKLGPGKYEVQIQAAGFQRDALQAKVEFAVVEPTNPEMHQLACNTGLLQQIADRTGGKFLREQQIGELSELLAPFSNGKIVESDVLLWQSYLWFIPIVILLALEWWLRKRAGLL
jgi:von Willebrand factor type A domain